MDKLLAFVGAWAFIIAIASLFKPDLTLRWASDGKKTRMFGLFFWFLVCLVCWIGGTALSHFSQPGLWVVLGILCICVIVFALYLHKFNSGRAEALRRKKEVAEQKKLAVQAQKAEKERQHQEQVNARKAEKERKQAEREKQREIDRRITAQIQAARSAYEPEDYENPRQFDNELEVGGYRIGYSATSSVNHTDYDDDWETEWRQYLRSTYGKKPNSTHERQLRKLFGGDRQCLYNFSMYEARIRRGETLCVVPADDYYRQRFDVLANNGVAIKFLKFNPELLRALSLPQMREVGRAAGLKSLCVDRAGSLKMLLELPEEMLAYTWTAAGVELNSIFQLLKPEDIYEEVKNKHSQVWL